MARTAVPDPAPKETPAERCLLDAGYRRTDHDMVPPAEKGDQPDGPRDGFPMYERADDGFHTSVAIVRTDKGWVNFYVRTKAGMDDYPVSERLTDLNAIRRRARRPVVLTTTD